MRAKIARRAGGCRRAATRLETAIRPNFSRSLLISTDRPGLGRRSPDETAYAAGAFPDDTEVVPPVAPLAEALPVPPRSRPTF